MVLRWESLSKSSSLEDHFLMLFLEVGGSDV